MLTVLAEFASDSRVVTNATETTTTNVITLAVNRIGGSVGVVSAQWRLIRAEGD